MQTFLNPSHSRKRQNLTDNTFYPNKSVVVFGDSITAGSKSTTVQNRWANKLAAETYGGGLLNQGSSGTVLQNTLWDTTNTPGGNNGRDRYISALTGSNKRDKCYILYGVNDIDYVIRGDLNSLNVVEFENDLTEIVSDLIANYGYTYNDIYIGSPPYFTAHGNDFKLHKKYVAAVRRIAISTGVRYADIFNYMIDNGGDVLLDSDNIHPNDAGHDVIYNGWKLANFVYGRAPIYHESLLISGINMVGETLQVDVGFWTSDDGDDNISFSYQWYADGVIISGATSDFYTLTTNENGKIITVEVKAVNSYGVTNKLSDAYDEVVSSTYQFSDANNTINAWFDPTTTDADYMSVSGSDIVSFTDRTANNRLLTAGGQPQISTINGLRSVKFDGTNDYFSGNAYVYGSGEYTAYLLIKPDTLINGVTVIYNEGYLSGSSFAYQFGLHYQVNGAAYSYFRTSSGSTRLSLNGQSDIRDNMPHILKIIDTGAAVKIYIDGVLEAEQQSYTRSGGGTPDVFGLGAFVEDTVNYYFKGEVGDMVFYDGQLSTSDDAGVNALLKKRWGV